jgi:hypothetical protein
VAGWPEATPQGRGLDVGGGPRTLGGSGHARQRRRGQRLLPREAEQGTPGVVLYLRRTRGAARAALCAANLATCKGTRGITVTCDWLL